MKKILITMASGPLATGIIEAIRALGEPHHIIGLDSNHLHILGADLDERFLAPRIGDPHFVPFVEQIIDETGPDLFWPLHDEEMPIFAAMDDLGAPTFLPEPPRASQSPARSRSHRTSWHR